MGSEWDLVGCDGIWDPVGSGRIRWDVSGFCWNPSGIWWDLGSGGMIRWDPVGSGGIRWDPVGSCGLMRDLVGSEWDLVRSGG